MLSPPPPFLPENISPGGTLNEIQLTAIGTENKHRNGSQIEMKIVHAYSTPQGVRPVWRFIIFYNMLPLVKVYDFVLNRDGL